MGSRRLARGSGGRSGSACRRRRTVAERAGELEVFGIRPDEGHGRAGGPAEEQLFLGDVRGVPDLFGEQAAFVGEAGEGAGEAAGLVGVAGGEFVVGALADEQRPGASSARAVEGGAVPVLAVAVAVVAGQAGPAGRSTLSRASMTLSVSRIRWSSGVRRPKRTRARASGLTILLGRGLALAGRAVLDGDEAPGGEAASATSGGAMRT